jgi:cohesin loading factor subunit SCC2
MVLDSSDVAYKCSLQCSAFEEASADICADFTPRTPSPKISQLPSLPTPALSASPERSEAIQNAIRPKISPRKQSVSPFTPGRKIPIVVIPPLPPGSQHKDYQAISDSPKRRKLDDDQQSARIALHVRAQKEEADAQLAKFQDLLFEIFEAQDQMAPDTSINSNPEDSQLFEHVEDAEDSSIVLTTKIHSKLQNAIKKLIDYKRFKDVPPDHIKRLQSLCEPALSVTQTLNLGLGSQSDEAEAEQWHARLKTAENGATSACTVGWTILGSLHDKSLFSEDVVQYLPNVLTNIFENCLVPVVEARSSGQSSGLFKAASSSKDILMRLLGQAKKLLDLVATLSVKMDGAEGAMNKTEFLATQLVFVENSHNDKDSVMGFQIFEQVRRTAMEALAKIFAKFPDQRPSILDEIVNSLEKLPSTTRAARQFKLTDGKNIQLFSALVVQLVQTATSEPSQQPIPGGTKSVRNFVLNGSQPEDSDEDPLDTLADATIPQQSTEEKSMVILLNEKAEALQSNARSSAHHIIKFLVGKAMRTTKTGDQPYRNLIDLFTEDLINILGSSDWPASELLLWMLARHMIEILKRDETGSAKNMAIELLGKMGSAISSLRVSVPQLAAAVHDNESIVSHNLQQFADDQLRAGIRAEDMVTADGPYKIILDFLHERAVTDWQLISAERFHLLQWAKVLCLTFDFDELQHSDPDIYPETAELVELVYTMLSNPLSVEAESGFERITTAQARLAYTLTVLNMNFCKLFDGIVGLLLFSISSDQAKIRSKSLKSVINLLEVDPSLLDRDQNILRTIFKCASDQSPMVRDSALSLIAKCMSLKPALEEDACKVILSCATDSTTGVRKRTIGLMKDIYVRDSRPDLQAAISKSLLERTSDHEESIAGLARQTLRELWISSLLPIVSTSIDSAKAHVAILEQTSMIVLTVSQNAEGLVLPLESFFRSAMKAESKDSSAVSEMCKRIVANLFEQVVNGSETQGTAGQERPSREGLLLTLVALAKADAKLVVPEQLKALQPYVSNLAGSDDLLLFRSVVNIYRCVLPFLSSSQQTLLAEIQNALFKTISKLPRTELNEVMACLWTIDGVLKNTDRLARLTISVLSNIHRAKIPPSGHADVAESEEQLRSANQLRSYVRIAGSAGKCWDLQRDLTSFKKAFPTWKGDSVAGLIVDSICPLASPNQQGPLRAMALESLGAVCQSWPGQFSKEKVREAFSGVFQGQSNDLQNIVLKAFAEFFGVREGISEISVDSNKDEQDQDLGRLGGSLKASDHDGAAALIAQHYLDSIIHVAMTRQDFNALTAMKIIASINRQGLKHPKETAGVLVALETSAEPNISNTAYESHRLMHQQHETLFEKEYMRAVQEAFLYQKTVVKDPTGATTRPFQSKLWRLFEVIQTSNARYVKKFISNLVSRADFERTTIDLSNDPPEHVLFVRFITQNIAYFEYGRSDELFHAILHLENLVGKSGTDLAQAIETLTGLTMHMKPAGVETDSIGNFQSPPIPAVEGGESAFVDPATLRRLVAAAMVLSMLWEARTHLKRQYGITQDVRQLIGKGTDAKELAKAPTKVHGVNGDRFWDNVASIMSSLDSYDVMMTRCHEFTNLMNVDDDVKVAAEDDETREAFSASVGPEGETSTPTMGGKGSRPGKRKSPASGGGTPKKKRVRPSLNGRRKSSTNLDDEDGDWE